MCSKVNESVTNSNVVCALNKEVNGLGIRRQSESTVDRTFALRTADLYSIPGLLYGPMSLPGVVFECISRSNP